MEIAVFVFLTNYPTGKDGKKPLQLQSPLVSESSKEGFLDSPVPWESTSNQDF